MPDCGPDRPGTWVKRHPTQPTSRRACGAARPRAQSCVEKRETLSPEEPVFTKLRPPRGRTGGGAGEAEGGGETVRRWERATRYRGGEQKAVSTSEEPCPPVQEGGEAVRRRAGVRRAGLRAGKRRPSGAG